MRIRWKGVFRIRDVGNVLLIDVDLYSGRRNYSAGKKV